MPFEPTIIGRVRQCPHCELRFADEWELDEHLRIDHHLDLDDIRHVFLKDDESPVKH